MSSSSRVGRDGLVCGSPEVLLFSGVAGALSFAPAARSGGRLAPFEPSGRIDAVPCVPSRSSISAPPIISLIPQISGLGLCHPACARSVLRSSRRALQNLSPPMSEGRARPATAARDNLVGGRRHQYPVDASARASGTGAWLLRPSHFLRMRSSLHCWRVSSAVLA